MSRQLYLLVIVVLVGSISCNQPNTKYRHNKITGYPAVTVTIDDREVIGQLNKMLHRGLYFKFHNYYSSSRKLLSEKYQIYFDIFHCDLFGYPELLEELDRILLKKYYKELTESEKIGYHLIKISHYQKKYEYKYAYAEVLKLGQFAENLDSFRKADLRQYHATFFALQHIPPMSVREHITDSIQLQKNWVHLYIPVSINGNMVNLIFDTGSEKSLISRSLAEKFGFKVIATKTEITGTTGARAATNLGIAEKVSIGNTIYENMVFEVIEDSLLGVPEYDFYFDGLVGFNLLYPLGSIALNADGLLKINTPSSHVQRNNLAIRQFSNRVSISFQDKTIPVKFDTGAYMSIFNKHFYELYASVLCEIGTPQSFEYGGIGGGRSTFNMLLLDTMACAVYNDSVFLRGTRVHSKYIHEDTVTYFGLLGLDFVAHFNEITMNFNPNSIEYKIRP